MAKTVMEVVIAVAKEEMGGLAFSSPTLHGALLHSTHACGADPKSVANALRRGVTEGFFIKLRRGVYKRTSKEYAGDRRGTSTAPPAQEMEVNTPVPTPKTDTGTNTVRSLLLTALDAIDEALEMVRACDKDMEKMRKLREVLA